jgi:hypothetical protein
VLENNLFQCLFIHCIFHTDHPGTEHGASGEKPATNLIYGTAQHSKRTGFLKPISPQRKFKNIK